MKTIIGLLICFAFAANINAQTPGKNSNTRKSISGNDAKSDSKASCTCVRKTSDGKVFVEQNGKEISTDIRLGTATVTPKGLIRKEGGAERILTEGNCISDNGTVLLEVK